MAVDEKDPLAGAGAEKTPTAKAAKKATKRAATGIHTSAPPAAQAAVNKSIEMSDEEIDREIRDMDLLLKRMQLKQSAQAVQKFEDDEASKIRKRASAQRALREEAAGKRNIAAQCEHRLGGFGLEDTYNGDDRPAIVVMDLPIAGMRKAFCVRCPKEWSTPDPLLKRTNPDLYVEQAMEWKECLKLIKQSRGKAMGGPTFAFEKEDGTPVHPQLV